MTPENTQLVSMILHWAVGAVLLLALIFFVLQFFLPALRVSRQLRSSRILLASLKTQGKTLDLDHIGIEVMLSDDLGHCWDEYRDTLHGQKFPNNMGVLEVNRWRATSMANAFFTDLTLIEAPCKTEFYKHLPGILTGLGIIGTFGGLIIGLQGFQVSDDAQVVRSSLETLIGSVGGAFIVSASAIALAMLVTTVEKALLNGLLTELERLCSLIDTLFDTGAGEEYLQRLVEASETSATQSLQMKEALVTELKQVLTELTQQQITAMTTTSQQLGHTITSTLTEGLADPLTKISNAVQQVGSNQGEAVNKLVTDVLATFTDQMQNMFGSQMRGMSDMLVQTANTIQNASNQFQQLAGQIQKAGTGAADAMAQRMDEALQKMQERQTESNEQMRVFVEQLKQSVANGQNESAEATMRLMSELGQTTSALVQELRDQAQKSQEEHSTRQTEIAHRSGAMLDEQSSQIARIAESVSSASASMENAIARLETATKTHIDGMNQGAEKLYGASSKLGDNLVKMKESSDGLSNVADKMNTASSSLTSALQATQKILADQQQVRDSLTSMVRELNALIEGSKREASLSAKLVDGLTAASNKLVEAQRNAEGYLEGVSAVLGEAHSAFAQQLMNTLREGNKAFHEELAQATGLLKGAIQDLGDVLDSLPASR